MRDSTGVTYGHQGKLAQDTLNGNDVKDRLLVVKLVHHKVQNVPCAWPNLAVPMSEGGQLPVIIGISRIKRISVKGIQKIFQHFSIRWLLPPSELEPRSANHISTVLTVRPRLQ